MILLLETSSVICSVAACSAEGKILAQKASLTYNSHAEELPVMVHDVLEKLKAEGEILQAVAVCKGPGSYTGLRIGTSLAKGLCFAQNIPLISASAFYGMAEAAKNNFPEADIIIAMLDARRDDVYMEVFDDEGKSVRPISAETLQDNILNEIKSKRVVICGNANEKWQNLVHGFANIHRVDMEPNAAFLAKEAASKYADKAWEDVAYYEPYYLKEFIPGIPKKFTL